MAEVTNELLLEVLKTLQKDIVDLKSSVQEIKSELHAIRGHILAIQTDIANLYIGQADVKASLERIEGCLNRS